MCYQWDTIHRNTLPTIYFHRMVSQTKSSLVWLTKLLSVFFLLWSLGDMCSSVIHLNDPCHTHSLLQVRQLLNPNNTTFFFFLQNHLVMTILNVNKNLHHWYERIAKDLQTCICILSTYSLILMNIHMLLRFWDRDCCQSLRLPKQFWLLKAP